MILGIRKFPAGGGAVVPPKKAVEKIDCLNMLSAMCGLPYLFTIGTKQDINVVGIVGEQRTEEVAVNSLDFAVEGIGEDASMAIH